MTTVNPSEITNGSEGRVFGIPVGRLGGFATVLISAAVGFATFFATTFLAIFSLLFYSSYTHRAVDYSLTYRAVGIPCGALALVTTGAILGTMWLRRIGNRA